MLETLDFSLELGRAGFVNIIAFVLLALHIDFLLYLCFEIVQDAQLALHGVILLAHGQSKVLVQTLQIAALNL